MIIGEPLSEKELCPDDLLRGQEEAFARDVARLHARSAEFVAVACPACGAADGTPTLEKYGFRYVTCAACRTLYMSPRPSAALMADYYRDSENYRYWATHIFPASETARRDKIHRLWLDRVVDGCDRFGVPRGRLVELGAGFGTFCELAREARAFAEVIAVEPNPEMAAACRARGVAVVPVGVEESAGRVADADVVVAFEMIEHLFEPRQLPLAASRLLRPGGLLVVSCPNGQGFDVAMLGADSWAIDAEHVNLFNPGSLRALVAGCGFDVVDVSTPGRLDAEFVRTAIVEGRLDASRDAFLRRVLVDEWERLGWPFQQFLAQHGLSSHMWLMARKR